MGREAVTRHRTRCARTGATQWPPKGRGLGGGPPAVCDFLLTQDFCCIPRFVWAAHGMLSEEAVPESVLTPLRHARTHRALPVLRRCTHTRPHPQSVPWGLAYSLAVQKESVGTLHATLGRPKKGQHPGPATLLRHRGGKQQQGPKSSSVGAPPCEAGGHCGA